MKRMRIGWAASLALVTLGLAGVASANWTKLQFVDLHEERPIINACFEATFDNYAWYPPYKEAIKAGVRDSWEAESAMVVNWWSSCSGAPSDSVRIRILDGDEEDFCGGTAPHTKSCCSPGERLCKINRECGRGLADTTEAFEWCLWRWMPHEWTHILGFPHEPGRVDCGAGPYQGGCPSDCTTSLYPDCSGCMEVGPCDTVSITDSNRDRDKTGSYPHLSPNDIAAVQRYYGSPQPVQGLAGPLYTDSYYDVFARGTNLQNMWRFSSPEGWGQFSFAPTSGAAGVSSWGPGRLDVFFRMSVAKPSGALFYLFDALLDGAMYHYSITEAGTGVDVQSFSDWMGSPVSVAPAFNRVEYFGRSGVLDKTEYARPKRTFWNGYGWMEQLLGSDEDKATGDLGAVRLDSTQISVFWRFKSTDEEPPSRHEDHNRLIMQTVTAGSTQVRPRVETNAVIASAPSAIQAQEGQSEVFVRGPNGGVYHLTCTADSCGSGPVYALGGNITGRPSAVAREVLSGYRDDIWVFGRSPGGNLWMNKLPAGSSTWNGWTMLGTTYQIVGSPKAVPYEPYPDFIQVYARSTDNELLVGYLYVPGGWFVWTNQGGQIH